MPLQSVTFDLDGTLVDTIADLAAACHAMLAELGLPGRSDADIHRFVGKGMAVLVERCLTWEAPPFPALQQAGVEAFCRHYGAVNGRRSTLYPGVMEGLQLFRSRGVRMGVVTNKPGAFTGPLLEALGVADFFSVVVSGDTLAFKKPRPEPLLHACRVLGVPPERNLHIGDSCNDIEAARAAGCPVICVPYGYNEGHPVDSADCDALVSDLVAAAEWAFPAAGA